MPVPPTANALAKSLPSGATIHFCDQAQCLVWYRNVQLILSLEPPTRQFMRRIIGGLEALEHERGQRVASLLIIRSTVAPPDEDARTYIRDELARSSMAAAAQVVEGQGFRGAAMRSVLSMIQLTIRPPFPMRVFSDVGEACSWLATELRRHGPAPDGSALAHMATQARDQFAAGSLPRT